MNSSDEPHYSAWAALLPHGWQTGRLKEFAQVRMSNVDKKTVQGEKEVLLCNYVDVYYNDMIAPDIEFMPATATDDQIKRFSLLGGDVLITKDSESWDDIAIPAFVPQDLPGVLCGYHLAHIRPGPELDGAFLARAFTAAGIRDQLRVAANGITRFGLPADAVSDAVFPVPPTKIQRAIAAFLDRKTAEIDALVTKKERLIELLEEKRTALITHAVTKGLDPNVKMKESGVEWLQQIPTSWATARLKVVAHLQSGNAITFESIRESDDYAVFGGNGIRGYTSAFTHSGDYPLIGRQGALCGCVNYGSGRFWASEHAIVVATTSPNVPRWLFHVLSVMNLNQYSLSAAQPGLAVERIRELAIPVPRPAEQLAISQFIDRESTSFTSLISAIGSAIARLNEYRSALITAAVTGQMTIPETPAEAA